MQVVSDSAEPQVPAKAGWRSWRLPAGLAEALWIFITLRIAFTVIGVLTARVLPVPPPCFHNEVGTAWTTIPELYSEGWPFRLLGIWQKWDGCWYEKIATFGYEPGQAGAAFYPLTPLLMRAVGAFTANNYTLAGMIVSGVAFVAAFTGFYRLVLREFDDTVARRTMWALALFPLSFFFFVPFTESLFLAMAVWSFYGARSRNWLLAGVAGFLAALSRSQGALLALPLGWEVARELWPMWRNGQGSVGERILRTLGLALVPAAPLYGFQLFATYTRAVAGINPVEAQAHWGLSFNGPWTVLEVTINFIRLNGDAIVTLNLMLLVLFWALAIIGLWRLPFSFALYTIPQLILVSTRLNPSPLTSVSRYMLVLFPCFIMLALLGRWAKLNQSWAVVSTMLLATLTVAFLDNVFVA